MRFKACCLVHSRCRKDCGCVSQPPGFCDSAMIGMTGRNRRRCDDKKPRWMHENNFICKTQLTILICKRLLGKTYPPLRVRLIKSITSTLFFWYWFYNILHLYITNLLMKSKGCFGRNRTHGLYLQGFRINKFSFSLLFVFYSTGH